LKDLEAMISKAVSSALDSKKEAELKPSQKPILKEEPKPTEKNGMKISGFQLVG